jgi:signal transduction histidine kinase
MESDVIQAFRLGATDFVIWPIREAEVVSAVERVLRQGRSRREREALARQLNQTNQELQRRVSELTTIFAIGKAVISTTDQQVLFDKILEGAAFVAESDGGWLLSRDERGKNFILRACRNVPAEIYSHLNQPFDDGISSLVALSGEALAIHGGPLTRFKVSRLGQSVMVLPIKVRKEVVGLLVSTRKAAQPFTAGQQALLEAVADYASISLVNTRLFKALEDRLATMQRSADAVQVDKRIQHNILQAYHVELTRALTVMNQNLSVLINHQSDKRGSEQIQAMLSIQETLHTVEEIANTMVNQYSPQAMKQYGPVSISDLVRQAVQRSLPITQQDRLQFEAEIPKKDIYGLADAVQISQVLDAILSNAVKFSPSGGKIKLALQVENNEAHLRIQDSGPGIDVKHLPHLFDASHPVRGTTSARYGGIGISLPLVKEILEAHGGKIWAESKPGEGSTFHMTLPAIPQ